MTREAEVALSLYLEFRASDLEVRLKEDVWGKGVLDYGVVVDGLRLLSAAQMGSLARRVRDNENDLVRLLANARNPDLRAIREEFDRG
jgi:hypothetical protein